MSPRDVLIEFVQWCADNPGGVRVDDDPEEAQDAIDDFLAAYPHLDDEPKREAL